MGEETFKLAQSYMDKLAKHGQQANKAALYGELCALLFAKSHYDEVSGIWGWFSLRKLVVESLRTFPDWPIIDIIFLVTGPGTCVTFICFSFYELVCKRLVVLWPTLRNDV